MELHFVFTIVTSLVDTDVKSRIVMQTKYVNSCCIKNQAQVCLLVPTSFSPKRLTNIL
jgi:hypothetical protein